MRKWWTWGHRWVGLLAGLLMAMMGLTGSVMVWQAELDAALNPHWFGPSACAGTAVQPDKPVATVLAVLAREAPQVRPAIIVAPSRPGASYQVWEARDARTGLRREHFVDPACGRYLGQRDRGAWVMDRAHAVPALYELHSRLLAGETGHLIIGSGGLLLLALAISGVVLAWPRRSSREAWRRTLSIKTDASAVRLWFDAHRALGLWLAPLLLLLPLTGAMLVFSDSARTVVSAVLPTQPRQAKPMTVETKDAGPSAPSPALPLDELVQRAQARFPAATWSRLSLPAKAGAPIELRLLQAGEPRVDTGNTRVRLDASGQVLSQSDPLNAPAGNVLLDWVFPLHSAEALGLLARLLWTVFGLLPALLFGTGLWLWWRRRRASAASRARSRPTSASPGSY